MSTEVIDMTTGEIVTLSELAADTSLIEQAADPVVFVQMAMQRAKAWLNEALEHGDIEQIAEIRSQAEAVRSYTATKQIGNDAVVAAQEIIRRSERGIATAIRKGQAAGEFNSKNDTLLSGVYNANTETGKRSASELIGAINRSSLSDFYELADGVSGEVFEAAIAEGKAEGDLSRAGLIRKVKGDAAPARYQPGRVATSAAGTSKSQRPDVLYKTHHVKPYRVVSEMVWGLEGFCHGLDLITHHKVIDLTDITDSDRVAWAESLRESRTRLSQLIGALES